jgi:hypothetical protein
MALIIAAGVFIGDLVAALTYLLRGEITSRFLAKALAVLLISGGTFFYYYFGQRKPEEIEIEIGPSRDIWMSGISALTVAVMVILGFVRIGGPARQRLLRADQKRVRDLFQLSQQIQNRWNANDKSLPQDLRGIAVAASGDPVTHEAYGYHVIGGSKYELCAIFSAASPENNGKINPGTWSHPAGSHCFALDSTQQTENPFIYLE